MMDNRDRFSPTFNTVQLAKAISFNVQHVNFETLTHLKSIQASGSCVKRTEVSETRNRQALLSRQENNRGYLRGISLEQVSLTPNAYTWSG